MTYFFESYGCQMNIAESASVEQLLMSRLWERAPSGEGADLVILNTCSVRITAETRVAGRIAHYAAEKKKRPCTLLVMGCMAERLHDTFFEEFPAVDYVVGMFERDLFSDIFAAIEQGRHWQQLDEKPVNAYHFASSSYTEGSFQSFVPIMNGCNNFCTYCIVPYVRGREVSRSRDEILAELDVLADRGVREITLLGQNVNSYSWTDSVSGRSYSFPSLLSDIARHIEKKGIIRWVRFMSSHPKDLSDELIDVIAREPAVCKLIHLPVQHGSDRILSAMNRRYSRKDYENLVERMRKRLPNLSLSTDILVGFPGETEEDLERTLELLQLVRYDAAFMYHYNPREGTKAYALPDRISDEVKKERLDRVIRLQHAITRELMQRRIGKEVQVLVESPSRNNPEELFGHTEQGEMVVFEGALDPSYIGNFVVAHLVSLHGRTFRARMIHA